MGSSTYAVGVENWKITGPWGRAIWTRCSVQGNFRHVTAQATQHSVISEPQNISKKSNLLWIILLINNTDHFRFRTKQKHHYLFIYFSLPVIFLHVNNADCRPSLHDELIRHTGFSQKLPSINWLKNMLRLNVYCSIVPSPRQGDVGSSFRSIIRCDRNRIIAGRIAVRALRDEMDGGKSGVPGRSWDPGMEVEVPFEQRPVSSSDHLT